MVDIRQNKNYAQYLEKLGWTVAKKDGVYYFIKKILLFSVMKVQRPKKIDLKFTAELAKKHKAFQVVIEPATNTEADVLIKKGWQNIFPFIPSMTTLLDLKKSESKILNSFTKDTRYCIRKSEKVNIIEEKDVKEFRRLWKVSVARKRHVLKLKEMKALKEIFGKDAKFLIAEDGISGGIFLVAGDVGYYWYGFVGKEGRKKLSQYKIVWEGIKWAKSRGAKQFDTEGIFDERFPIPAWRGFTKFKKGFKGEVVKYPGAYQKIILPF